MAASIRRLPETVVNRIAAGEVIERPAAAIKELVENSIDAGATRVEVTMAEAGRALIAVVDDGVGMSREELALAIERHATSKLPDDDLLRIGTLGFRGEALPSIGAVSRMSITSRPQAAAEAWRLEIEGGEVRVSEGQAADAGRHPRRKIDLHYTPTSPSPRFKSPWFTPATPPLQTSTFVGEHPHEQI